MKTIHIMLVHVDTLVLKSIRFYTKKKYNHISLSIDGNMSNFYSFGRKVIWFPLIGGLIKENINKGIYKQYKNTNCLISEMNISDEEFNRLKTLLDFFLENSYKFKYNYAAILGIVLNKPISIKNRFTCSEFVAYLLSQSGIFSFNTDISSILPEDFIRLPKLIKVYEGFMGNFDPINRDLICNTGNCSVLY